MKLIVILLILSFINDSFSCSGCVDLSELTFSKVINKFRTVLVKFDVQFPFGDTHDAYVEFANQISNMTKSGSDHPEILCATVGVKDYGELDNKYLGEKYGFFKSADFPGIIMINDGDLEKPIKFEIGKDTITVNMFYTFLKTYSKVYVLGPGCVKDLDELAEKFMNESPSKRPTFLEETERFVENIDSEEKKNTAKTYIVIMKGVNENGEDYISKQRDRINKLLKTKLTENKAKELNLKLSIIASFKPTSAPQKEEL